MIIAVDFDGVLHERIEGQPFMGRAMPGAKEFMLELLKTGHRVIIFTARAGSTDGFASVALWLSEQGFPRFEITNIKPAAAVFIDDRAYRFTGDFAAARAYIDTLQ